MSRSATRPTLRKDLSEFLNPLFERYHRKEYLSSDPLEFVHRFSDPWDQECVALLGAVLAYGNAKQVRRSVEDALTRMKSVNGESPAEFVRELPEDAARGGRRTQALQGFVHRFNVGSDLVALFGLLALSWKLHGSLGAHFVSYLEPQAKDFSAALEALVADWRSWAGKLEPPPAKSFSYLLTSPADGSCCKRWCMLLRWMGRRDSLDPGLWTEGGALARTIPPGRHLRADQLVLPLDTHTGRITRYLGLSRRKSIDWKTALEVTESLRGCDASDPTRYDFAIARLGILSLCRLSYRPEICVSCELLPVCQFAQRGQRIEMKRALRATQASAPHVTVKVRDNVGSNR